MDQVFMKKTIKKDALFENHPNFIFGLIIIAFSVLVVASIFLTLYIPFWILPVLWVVAGGILIYWIIKKNDNANSIRSIEGA